MNPSATDEGLVTAGVGGNYDVWLPKQDRIVTVKARGLFRKQGISPLIGDRVSVSRDGFLEAIHPRTNQMIRPACANVDQLMIVFSFHDPEPNFIILDKFLAESQYQGITPLIVFTKSDLSNGKDEVLEAQDAYLKAGYQVFSVTVKNDRDRQDGCLDLTAMKAMLVGKITVLAGPSGSGKSSLINALTGSRQEVGELSRKISRGRNTTRHARLLKTDGGGWIADTPGFTSFYTFRIPSDQLDRYYPDFAPFLSCRYPDCRHIHEPGCGVIQAVREGRISPFRYRSYCRLYDEVSRYEKEHPHYKEDL